MNRTTRTPIRALAAALAALVAAVAMVLLPALPASAGSASGWVRLAHLSPDTKAVDVTLSSLSGGTVLYKLSSVAYGDVSKYMRLPAGTYAIAMVPADAPASTTPIVRAQATVVAGKAETVAAIGLNRSLQTKVYSDDLTGPAGKAATVRVVQASVKHPTVDVRTGSTTLANGTAFGKATGYAKLSAGRSTLDLSAAGLKDSAAVTLPAGTVHTLFVLDDASGSLSVTPVLDSSASTVAPVGSIDTGAGGLAGADGGAGLAGPMAVLSALVAALAGVLLVRRGRVRPTA